ncbi:phenylacetaldoxime dehydratase family protein [Teredinibacter haidensis]|uniref:phenylacetaldoxime dehydratase family protein n=1 Tax=Teredinibacter haidensis TaxID=2731755 RepID=UPI001115363E|nr:phenylacetaldoxime dehydratase family protein [Teredinibacter haidensis]
MQKQKSSSSDITQAFADFKGVSLNTSQFTIVEQNTELSRALSKSGFAESRFFVSYWPTPECVEGYTVFEKCGKQSCNFKFEWVEGVCD